MESFELPEDLETINHLDNGNEDSTTTNSEAEDDGSKRTSNNGFKLVQSLHRQAPSSVIFESLIELLVSFYEKDSLRRQALFSAICCHLRKMKLLTASTFDVPGLGPLRSQYQQAFARLISLTKDQLAASASKPPSQSIPRSASYQLLNSNNGVEFFYRHSRYESEFEELSYLAKGGFGSVYRVRNKLDNCEYAVKKIVLRYDYRNPNLFSKIFREVTTLAKLSHPNIVSYKTAWIEPIPTTRKSRVRSRDGTTTTATTTESPSRSSNSIIFEEEEEDDSSDSIVFQDVIHSRIKELDDEEEENEKLEPIRGGLASTPPGDNKNNLIYPKKTNKFWLDVSSSEEDSPTATSPNQKSKKKGCYWPANLVRVNENKLKSLMSESKTIFRPGSGAGAGAGTGTGTGAGGSSSSRSSRTFVGGRAMLYLQMQLCEDTLRSWLNERNSQAEPQVSHSTNLGIVNQLLKGVEYIHSQGIIHRDLKPRNIFISEHGSKIQIGDFGLAKQEIHENAFPPTTPCSGDENYSKEKYVRRKKTRHTSGVGTQAYAAPEQLSDGLINFKSDMYSVGIILFELYQPFGSAMERSLTIGNLREKGTVPPEFKEKFPQMASVVVALTNPISSLRPSASQLLNSEFSSQAEEKLRLAEETRNLKHLVEMQQSQLSAQAKLISDQNEELAFLRSQLLRTEELRKFISQNHSNNGSSHKKASTAPQLMGSYNST